MSGLRQWLQEPGAAALDLDGEARLAFHRAVLGRKRMIREVFTDFHTLFRRLETRYLDGTGLAVEVGAGVAAMRDSYPGVLSTDVVFGRHLDCVMDAQALPFADESVRVVYAQNSFHHLPDPERFLAELARALSPGGGALLLEPYHGPAASFVYPRLFRSEGFDKRAPDWRVATAGPMHGANQAQSYVVFVRDRARFEARFPTLEIVHREPLRNYVRYLASGGLNFRQLVPDAACTPLRALEWALAPLRRWLALHHVLVLRKVRR